MKKIYLVLIAILLVGSVIAEESFVFKKDTTVDLRVPVYASDNSKATSATVCNLTVDYPNKTVAVNDKTMGFNLGGYFNYTIFDTILTESGTYHASMECTDGSDYGFSTFTFLVNARGKENTTADSLLYLGGLVLLIIFFMLSIYGFLYYNHPTLKLFFALTTYILLVGISYVAWMTTENMVLGTEFLPKIFYWLFVILMIGFFPIMICVVVWYIWLLVSIKQIKDMMDRGVPEDRAYVNSIKSDMARLRNEGVFDNKWR